MSTRCQIAFYEDEEKQKDLNNFEALLYRHSDGYPEGVLPDIMPFLEWWKGARSINDMEYCSARLLQYLCNEDDRLYKEKWEDITSQKEKGLTGIYGHGISKLFHWDIEYIYAITPEFITVYDTNFCDKDKDINKRSKQIGKKIKINKEEVERWLEQYQKDTELAE